MLLLLFLYLFYYRGLLFLYLFYYRGLYFCIYFITEGSYVIAVIFDGQDTPSTGS